MSWDKKHRHLTPRSFITLIFNSAPKHSGNGFAIFDPKRTIPVSSFQVGRKNPIFQSVETIFAFFFFHRPFLLENILTNIFSILCIDFFFAINTPISNSNIFPKQKTYRGVEERVSKFFQPFELKGFRILGTNFHFWKKPSIFKAGESLELHMKLEIH